MQEHEEVIKLIAGILKQYKSSNEHVDDNTLLNILGVQLTFILCMFDVTEDEMNEILDGYFDDIRNYVLVSNKEFKEIKQKMENGKISY